MQGNGERLQGHSSAAPRRFQTSHACVILPPHFRLRRSQGRPVALSATLYNFDIQLADADRNVYETLALRIARHPSESAEFLFARLLAYCLEYTEGLAFSSGGLSDTEAPALAVRDLTGALQKWIEVGTPDAARLHKASKAAPRVAVYPHRDVEAWLERIRKEKIHRAAELAIHVIEGELLASLAAKLERRMKMDVSVADRNLYITVGEETLSAVVELRTLS
jgi:uncharacterized protein YaeQ